MACNLLTPTHIQKLGHPIEEIRTRALHSVWSKYSLELVDDSNSDNTKLLLEKLIDWFNFETHPHEEKVFKLIIKVLSKVNCNSAIKGIDLKQISAKIDKIKIEVNRKHVPLIEEIKEWLRRVEKITICHNEIENMMSGTEIDQNKCAFAIQHYLPLQMKTHINDVLHKNKYINFDSCEPHMLEDASKKNEKTPYYGKIERCAPVHGAGTKIEYFPWQLLPINDSSVLPSLYDGLRYMDNIDSILQSCQFYTDILLQDFPSEVFLQRPLLIQTFFELLQCNDPQVCVQATTCLLATMKHLTNRLQIFLNASLIHSKECYRGVKLSKAHDDDDENSFENHEPQKLLNENESYGSGLDFEKEEETVLLKSQQYSFSEICFLILSQSIPILSKEKTLQEYNLIVELVLETFSSLTRNFTSVVWCNKQLKERIYKIFNLFYGPVKYQKSQNSIIYSIIIHLMFKMLKSLCPPDEQYQDILPRGMQLELVECVSDYIFILTYPNLYNKIKILIDKFVAQREKEMLEIHEISVKVCDSMKSAVEFLKHRNKLNTKVKMLNCVEKALHCLEFHRNFQFIQDFIKICLFKWSEKQLNLTELNLRKSILLKLLSHNDSAVKLAAYKELHTYVIRYLGIEEDMKPKYQYPGDKFEFLFDSEVLIEMICHGINSDQTEIQNISSEIFVHILKGRIFFSEKRWNNLMRAMSPCLCLLQCFADKTTSLGRCVFKMLDPDISNTISLSSLDLLRGNLRLLFSKNNLIREEALLRLFWLLTKEDPEKVKLPRLSLLRGINLSSICSSVEPEELSSMSHSFFNADSLNNVMEMLTADGLEPSVRRSALTQISVMLEDSHFHSAFLEQNSLQIFLDIFKNCLIEKEFQNYPDSVIPLMKILKHICLDNPSVRIQLSQNISLYYCILRGLLLFSSERQSRQQGVELLCLLLYSECIINVKNDRAIMCKISVPEVLVNKICLPFLTHIHWKYSQFAEPSKRDSIMLREKSASLLRIYWNVEWFGGISRILELKNNDLEENIFSPFLPTNMMLKTEDLATLKNCSIPFGIKHTLFDIQNATSHEAVILSLHRLNSYLILYDLERGLDDDDDNDNNTKDRKAEIMNMKWTSTFKRFLSSKPSCEDDEVLLNQVIYSVRLILRTVKSKDLHKWIGNLLTDEIENLPSVLKSYTEDNSTLIHRDLSRALTGLIKDTIMRNTECLPKSWLLYIKLITRQLKLNKKHEFHNVAHVDCLLSILADVTGSSGPSNVHGSDLYKETISTIMETIVAFHCTKYSPHSFFGTNIIRNCLIILNNILSETQATTEDWECLWHHALSDVTWHNDLPDYSWLLSLWLSRDPVVKALTVQILSGFALTSKSCELLLENLHIELEFLWNEGSKILLDDKECNVVREKAAFLLSNLICDVSGTKAKEYLQNLMEINMCETLSDLLDKLHVNACENEGNQSYIFQRYSSRFEDGFEVFVPLSTPSLVSAVCNLLINITFLSPEHLVDIIVRTGILENLMKIFYGAAEASFNYRDNEYSIDLIKMYKNCCKALTKFMSAKYEAQPSVNYYQQFIKSVFNLMNYSIYDDTSTIVLEERNQLWCEILDALSVIITQPLEKKSDMERLHLEGFRALNCAMTENGTDCFISTLYLAASSNLCELRMSCFRFLTNFFGIESQKFNQFTITDIFDRCILSDAIEHAEKFCWKGLSINKTDLNFGRSMSNILLQMYRIDGHGEKLALETSYADALGSLLSVCENAQNHCLDNGLADDIAESLRTTFIRLTMENVDCLKKSADRKRIDTVLLEIEMSYRLLTNLLTGNEKIKSYIANNGLASLVHKVWHWCTARNSLLNTALKMLCTYTLNSDPACRSLALDKSWSVIGLRKPQGSVTLIQTVMLHIEKEMNLVSRNQNAESLQLSFQLLENCCRVTECRCLMAKGMFIRCFAGFYYGSSNKKRLQSEFIMELWLNFFIIFTSHQEGQLALPRYQDALEAIVDTASGTSNCSKRKKALNILRNISFHQLNRVQLLGDYKFLSSMIEAIKSGDSEEIKLASQTIWGLICNSQKGKIIIRNTGLETVLKEVTKKLKLTGDCEHLLLIDTVSQILINK